MLDVKWAATITTAPRKDCTLNLSIESIRYAGWEPTVFAEPGSTEVDAHTIWNRVRLGVWHNWLKSARYLIEETDADVLITLQDDIIVHPESKSFIEQHLWPDKNAGFVSLYTPRHYSHYPKEKSKQKPPGIHRVYTRSLWGACALIFPRKVLEAAINSQTAKSWLGVGSRTRSKRAEIYQRRRNNPHLIQNSDTAIGLIMNRLHKSMWFVQPSLAIHIAKYSSISHGGNGGNRNCKTHVDFEQSISEVIPKPTSVVTL